MNSKDLQQVPSSHRCSPIQDKRLLDLDIPSHIGCPRAMVFVLQDLNSVLDCRYVAGNR